MSNQNQNVNNNNSKSTQQKRRRGRKKPNNNNGNPNFMDSNNNKKQGQLNNFNDSNPNVDNDASWYAANEVLLNNAANLPFPYAVGSTYDFRYANTSTESVRFKSLPGVMAIKLMPTVGADGTSAVTPINMAANNMYSYVRHMNSGASNYDAPDLMVYILAMDSCYSYYAMLTRLYGVMRNFSAKNYYKPEAIVRAMGIDYKDIEQHLPDLRYYINLYASKLETLRIPTTMSYLTRHMWIYSGLYTDYDNDKGQIYMYVPDGFYQYHEDTSTPSEILGNLTYKPFYDLNVPKKFADLVNFGNQMLEVNRNSEDHNIMSGDIAKAFGNNVFTVPSVGDDYTVEPTYSKEVLMQIHNCTVLSGLITNGGVKQDRTTGKLSNTIKVSTSDGNAVVLNAMDVPLDMDTDDVKPADIMVATRLISRTKTTATGSNTYLVHTSGSEIVTGVTMFNYDGDMSRLYAINFKPFVSLSNTPTSQTLRDMGIQLMNQTKFDWAPTSWIDLPDPSNPEEPEGMVPVADYNNLTVARVTELEKMNEVALLSMFGVK